ncbi:MAG: hypothetical protein AB7U05_09050 [Mangrovibacterium sp.]
MENQVGIEQLKKNLAVIAKTTGTVDAALADGKIDTMEAIGIAKDALGFFGVVRNLKEAKAELADLTTAEKTELVAHFRQEFDLKNDMAEMVVETVVEIALGFIKLAETREQAA